MLLIAILLGGLILTAALTLTTFMNDYEQLIAENCHIPANREILMLVDQYEQARGKSSPYKQFFYPRFVNGINMLLMTTIEIVIYFMFFRFLYRHNNKKTIRSSLDPQVIQKRNKRNAITFFGQFCSFLFEISVWILFVLTWVIGKEKLWWLWAIVSILRFLSFTIMAFIDVATSKSLRQVMFRHLRKFLKLFI